MNITGRVVRLLHCLAKDEEGATAVEYAVMLALIVVACIVAIGSVGTTASSLWGSNESTMDIAWEAAGGSGGGSGS